MEWREVEAEDDACFVGSEDFFLADMFTQTCWKMSMFLPCRLKLVFSFAVSAENGIQLFPYLLDGTVMSYSKMSVLFENHCDIECCSKWIFLIVSQSWNIHGYWVDFAMVFLHVPVTVCISSSLQLAFQSLLYWSVFLYSSIVQSVLSLCWTMIARGKCLDVGASFQS